MKKVALIFSVLLMILSTAGFFGCSDNNNGELDGGEHEEEEISVTLTLSNYKEYFTLQEEIISYNESKYQTSGGTQFLKADRTTKFSILLLKSNIKFDDVTLTIENKTPVIHRYVWQNGGYKEEYYQYWRGSGGTLRLSYDGEGFLTLTASYDDKPSEFRQIKYEVTSIKGNIKIKK